MSSQSSSSPTHVNLRQHLSSPTSMGTCICSRPVGHLLCRICGHYMAGRKMTHCSEHPNVVHLMDLRVCPVCKCDNSLSELQQYL